MVKKYSGSGQSPDFVLPALVRQFAEIAAGKREPVVHLGNLSPVRDFSDVRDIVGAYRLALLRGRSGEAYNLGSGRGVSVRELFELMSQKSGTDIELHVEPARERATDISYLVGDVSKARKELGWRTEIMLSQTVEEMLEAARRSMREQAANEGTQTDSV